MAIAIKTQTALIGGENGDIILSETVPCPPKELEDVQVAVEVKAIALNPVDTKMVGGYLTPGAVSGCEFAGIVTELGAIAAKDGGLKVGDRVAGVVMGMNPLRPRIGAFSQYTVSSAYGTVRIPDDWTFEKAAAGVGGVAWATVPWALFHSLGLPSGPLLEPLNSQMPPPDLPGFKIPIISSHTADGTKPPTTVLVSGGASFTGTCAIQLLKLAGFTVIATCSPKTSDLVKSFGADATFDYSSPTCAADIKTYTRNCLRLALDCITTADTTRLCYSALGRAGGRYVALDPYSSAVSATRSIVHADWVFGMDLLGEDVGWPAPHGRNADPVATEFGVVWNKTLQSLLDRGLVRPHPQIIRATGLAGALEGIQEIRAKKNAGQKLVYTL
ncbi:chaperonin 10-like protein [Coniella lustricola]|uniref:Chaperonin 10-like protein n=1 Tax=Coniella lustricola TaxID=2025994 RepID=A0A2T3A7C1_9PEZI|nr:chaperonin 10-like protein [Coniella lustricola]